MQRRLQPRTTEAAAYPAWQVTGCAGRFALDVLRALVCHQAHKLTTYSFEQAVEAVCGALQPYGARLQPCVSRLQPTISGDLNCDGSDAAIKLLTTGAVEADDPDWLHGEEPQPSPEF